jgi:membrane protein required for colicin V production
MYWLDTVILAVLALAALWGARTGLVGQAARLVALGVAIFGAIRLNDRVTPLLAGALTDAPAWAAQALAYAAVFLVIYATLITITLLLEHGVEAARMQWMNRLLGAGLGAIKAGVVLGFFFLGLVTYLPEVSKETLDRSALAVSLTAGARKICDAIPEEYRENLRAQLRHLEGLQGGGKRPDGGSAE